MGAVSKIQIPQRGCFNTIRIILAFKVMLIHAIWHLDITSAYNVLYSFSKVKATPVFFMLSGFLIWGSIGRSKSFNVYFQKRFWRIFPELWVAVGFGLTLVLLLYDKPINWSQFVGFAFAQGTCLQFWTPDCLREYGNGVPNGALGSIGILIQFYLLAFLIYHFLHGEKMRKWLLALLMAYGLGIFMPIVRDCVPIVCGKLLGQTIFPYLWIFLTGTFFAEYKERVIPVLMAFWWLILGVFILVEYTDFDIKFSYYVLRTLTLFLGLTGFAYAYPKLNVGRDLSYGIYLYHMIVVNVLIVLGFKQHLWLLPIVVMISGTLALFSSCFVGDFAEKMKNNIKKKSHE